MRYNIKLILISLIIYISSFLLGLLISLHKYAYNFLIFNRSFTNIYQNQNSGLFKYILINNIKIIFIILLGFLSVGLTTIINIIYNGVYFGYLVAHAVYLGYNIEVIILLTFPHGIFEIPAIIIAGAAGFKIPYEIVRYLAGRKEQPLTKEDIKEYLMLALISIILIVIAAFVEAYITPKIAEYFLGK